jgi:hypothetical protein
MTATIAAMLAENAVIPDRIPVKTVHPGFAPVALNN